MLNTEPTGSDNAGQEPTAASDTTTPARRTRRRPAKAIEPAAEAPAAAPEVADAPAAPARSRSRSARSARATAAAIPPGGAEPAVPPTAAQPVVTEPTTPQESSDVAGRGISEPGEDKAA